MYSINILYIEYILPLKVKQTVVIKILLDIVTLRQRATEITSNVSYKMLLATEKTGHLRLQ